MMSARMLVTGAKGWIGRHVAFEAGKAGHSVTALDMPPAAAGAWADYRVADIQNDSVLALAGDVAVRGARAIIHCAGYAHRPRETPEEVARFDAINRQGTARVLELARRAGIPRVVYLSSIAFYDWSSGAEMGEEDALATPTAYAKSKLDGEMLCRESGLDWRVARLGTVFGAGDRANFSKLAGAMAKRRFVVPGAGTARKSVLPVTLAAELLVDLALRDDVPERLVNLALPEAPTLGEICGAFSQACGFPAAPRVPLPILRAAAFAGDMIDRVKPGFPLTSVNVRKLTQSTVVKTERMQRVWPNRQWPTFAEALAPAAEYYRSL
ncbi:NAD(P)-dependent oxidoreductase [Opitutus sp. ER46]|uniref:NAD-dependent epimerase/dehydratase family protein n=1 Tax=Opitutus sp. ER46 TaxID=2161864 RepID=UPI000D2F6B58|nr:NAD(P)-dependent oxidoreductase [Opitutus sp. ER46]PTX98376.1 hypothetical protein DB354_03660 [Opitutus sp. ER46]